MSTYQAKIIDDNNMEYTSNSIENFGYDQNSNGTVQPNTSTTGTFYLLSKEKPQITNFKINISEQYSDSQDKLGDSGIAQKVNESN